MTRFLKHGCLKYRSLSFIKYAANPFLSIKSHRLGRTDIEHHALCLYFIGIYRIIYRSAQHKGEVLEWTDCWYHFRMRLPVLPVGLYKRADLGEQIQCHLRKFRRTAFIAFVVAIILVDMLVRCRVVIRFAERQEIQFREGQQKHKQTLL